MAIRVGKAFARYHCGQPMDTWRNAKWDKKSRGLKNFRFWVCMECGHREEEILRPEHKYYR